METIFDPDKDARNVAKHGVSLGEAASVNWNSVRASVDRGRDYGEQREVGFGLIGFPRANSREVKRYAQQIGQTEDIYAEAGGGSPDQ